MAGVSSSSESPLPLILASASPRRVGLLTSLGIPLEVSAPEIDERPAPGESAEQHVLRAAREKAAVVGARFPGRIILAADTSVVLEGRIYGKPVDASDARRMLGELQGRTHQVLTGYAVLDGEGRQRRGVEVSLVTMKALSASDIEDYLKMEEYSDKAGAYAAQGKGAGIIEKIAGSYSNVVGLPVGRVARILRSLGYAPREPFPD